MSFEYENTYVDDKDLQIHIAGATLADDNLKQKCSPGADVQENSSQPTPYVMNKKLWDQQKLETKRNKNDEGW